MASQLRGSDPLSALVRNHRFCSHPSLSGRASCWRLAADPFEAADTLVDEIADLESDEDLLHLSSDDDGDSEEEKAVQAAPPAPTPAAAAGRGRVRSDSPVEAPMRGRGGKG